MKPFMTRDLLDQGVGSHSSRRFINRFGLLGLLWRFLGDFLNVRSVKSDTVRH